MPSPRLAFVVPGGLDRQSGGYQYDRYLRDGLIDRGWTVDVISVPHGGYHRRVASAFDRSLREELTGGDYDLILQDALAHPTLWLLNRRIRRVSDPPIVALVHLVRQCDPTSTDRLGIGRRYEQSYFTSVDAYVCTSRATREAVGAFTDPFPSIVAYPGRRDRQRPRAQPRPTNGPLTIGFIGHITPIKGLDVLIDALSQVTHPVQLTVIGSRNRDASHVADVDRLIHHHGLADRVTFTGALAKGEVERQISRFDLVVVPSRYEGFGMAYLEAMGHGVPPVGTTAGGASELITDGRTGFLVPPEDPDRLAAVIEHASKNRAACSAIGEAARRRARHHLSWAMTIGAIDRFLRQLVVTSPRRSPDRGPR